VPSVASKSKVLHMITDTLIVIATIYC